jgi:tryptophanase
MTIAPDFEPFRPTAIAPVQAITTTPQQRRRFLIEAEHNLFRLRSDQVMIDLLTDSGTGVMSANQWAAMMRGDESYAGSLSYHRLADVVRQVTGMPHMLPVHQGRIAERLLVEAVIGKFPNGAGMIVPNNAHFDTTRSMIESSGAEVVNLIDIRHEGTTARTHGGELSTTATHGDPLHITSCLRASVPSCLFLGDISPAKLEELLQSRGEDVPFVLMTVTCNSNGGQPVSLDNLRDVREICDRHRKMLILDACRFAENAWFIKQREAASGTVASIVRKMFDLADGAVMSTRKDALCNVGGLLLLRHEHYYRKACNLCVLTDGFQMTYGTLPGRDLEALAVGLQEAIDEAFLTARIEAVQRLADDFSRGGIGVIQPAGGHAVFIDAEDFCPHLARAENPAHALACAIYHDTGIRCTRIGTILKNHRGEPMEIVRLAIPRRRYTLAQMDYVAASIIDLKTRAHEIQGMKTALPTTLRCEEPAVQAA